MPMGSFTIRRHSRTPAIVSTPFPLGKPPSPSSSPSKLSCPLEIPGLVLTPASPDPSLDSFPDSTSDACESEASPHHPSNDIFIDFEDPSSSTLSFSSDSKELAPPLLAPSSFAAANNLIRRSAHGKSLYLAFVLVVVGVALGLGVGFSQKQRNDAVGGYQVGEIVSGDPGTGASVVIAISTKEANGSWVMERVTTSRRKVVGGSTGGKKTLSGRGGAGGAGRTSSSAAASSATTGSPSPSPASLASVSTLPPTSFSSSNGSSSATGTSSAPTDGPTSNSMSSGRATASSATASTSTDGDNSRT